MREQNVVLGHNYWAALDGWTPSQTASVLKLLEVFLLEPLVLNQSPELIMMKV
jgi:hypothetical protein